MSIKIESSGELTSFRINGLLKSKDFYEVEYEGNKIGLRNIFNHVDVVNPSHYSNWVNSEDVAFASRLALEDALIVLISTKSSKIFNGRATTSAGVAVNLDSNPSKSVLLKAESSNLGAIYVGGPTLTIGNGFQLAAGDTLELNISDTNKIWIISSVGGYALSYIGNS
jgi:hypothetical protein